MSCLSTVSMTWSLPLFGDPASIGIESKARRVNTLRIFQQINDDLQEWFTVYTIEMAYAHMRQLQELANRSRAHQPAAAHRVDKTRKPGHTKKA
ncbi:hypothetical protein GCM10010371_12300 [Streptomyces subrutilus]|uniref:Uncharacterized protein n=1 Tax=Streptomyces subrutilus TaxID=36818 RepID=A0A918QLW4_9ACTN|nr:hypothetical protein GCM10010371_12300 [Streptomyces subrutilus]